MPRLIILADDLTGAADTAACFAQAGLRTVVILSETGFFLDNPVSSFDLSDPPAVALPETFNQASYEVLSLSTNTRQATPGQAALRVRQAVDWLQEHGLADPGAFFYKKIDSLLRGHPAVELAAMQAALSLDRALVAPAFPAQGRFTLAGRQVVGSGDTAQHIDLRQVFGSPPTEPTGIHWLPLDHAASAGPAGQAWNAADPGLYIADAASEDDLEALARGALAQGIRLACGSAGLARALQRVAFTPESRAPANRPARSRLGRRTGRPVLVVAGSRAPALLRQVEAARRSGIRVVTPGPSFLEGAPFHTEELASALAETLRRGQPAILTTAGLPLSPLGDTVIAGRLAGVASSVVKAGLVGGLLLTGGDTAAAVCQRLGAHLIELTGEPLPGIAAGALLDGPHSGLPVITKAGAFECDLGLLIVDF